MKHPPLDTEDALEEACASLAYAGYQLRKSAEHTASVLEKRQNELIVMKRRHQYWFVGILTVLLSSIIIHVLLWFL